MLQVTVILEHMFHPSEMEEEATLREDLEDDIKSECTKMGPVEKVSFYACFVCLYGSELYQNWPYCLRFLLVWLPILLV